MEEKVFFNRILQLRTENNLSQAELSEYLGIIPFCIISL